MDPITATIDEIASEYAIQFTNGNRKYVIREIAKLPTGEAIAVAANITHRLSAELQQGFVRLTDYFATN